MLINAFYWCAGLAFLALAKVKHMLEGYQTPKPFSLAETERCIQYDIGIAENWLTTLARYAQTDVRGKHILELGPGSDLGVGLYLLSKEAASYTAIDRHDLATHVPRAFYEAFSKHAPVDLAALTDGRIRYIVEPNFNLRKTGLPAQSFDLIVSNAAFEHFYDPESVINDISRLAKPRGIMISVIDLQTHSRWIRQADPNNIYRYPAWLYDLFHFPGQPNRWRPDLYRMRLKHQNWSNIEITPSAVLAPELRSRNSSLNEVYRRELTDMDVLAVNLCATLKV